MNTLRTEHIIKDYPGTRALDDVSVSFDSGKIHAFIGKNGSGKSTLVKLFAGAERPTSGKIFLGEQELHLSNPMEALEKGIATVYQELSLVPYLSVAENIYLGRLPKRGRVVDKKRMVEMASGLLESMGVDIDPREKVFRLSMWQCQIVEIVKAMSTEPKVLMLDEPTSALANNETQRLFQVIKRLRSQGVLIIYISHRLQELWEIADDITVLRDGRLVGSVATGDIDHKGLVGMMFGDVEIRTRPENLVVGEETVLSVEKLTRAGKFEDVSFELKKGEILGIAGMLGAGRTELLRSIFGADPYDHGSVRVNGEAVRGKPTPERMKKVGLALTPEERKREGVILIHSIRDNLTYASLDKISRRHIIDVEQRKEFANRRVDDLQIKIASTSDAVSSLSGGNQQKIVVGNWLNTDPQIMMYDEPSRGIDVSAKQQIFQIMWNESRKGVSSIFVSSELEELLEVCHRVLVMYMGRIVGEVDPEKVQIDELYAYCMGGNVQ